jgi:ketosteroid isomerase-like protein
MRLMARAEFIDIVEHRYFGSMAAAAPKRMMPLLTEDAVLTGFFGTHPPRIVRRSPSAGEESFAEFFGALHAEFSLGYSHFVHFVDLEAQQCACTFLLEIAPHDRNSPVPQRRLRNCNFFRFKDGLISEITAYFAQPSVDVSPWA